MFKFVKPDQHLGPKYEESVFIYRLTFNENIIVLNSLVPDQVRRFVGHDLDPKCLKRISAERPRYFLFDHIAHRRAGRSSV